MRTVAGTASFLITFGALAAGLGGIAVYSFYSRDLPAAQELTAQPLSQSTKIYDRNGVLLYELYDPDQGRRVEVGLEQVPEHVRNAFLSAEDARFYENPGVDLRAIVRAALDNYRSGGDRISGASTITQQLVKNTLLGNERTLSRKIREAILAVNVSQTYSKDQILALYLNTSYFGNQAYGIEAAAETYFAKPAHDLTLSEGALLAGLVRSPALADPFVNLDGARAEQRRVLDAMALHGAISQDVADQAAAEPLALQPPHPADIKAPHFVFWVRQLLEANPKIGARGLYQRGLSVTTTLDYRMQQMAELMVQDHVAGLGSYNVHDGALVALNPQTGEILAMVGSADYANQDIQGEVNVALAPRQPGSSIKPITYLAAFQKGWSPSTIIDDAPTTFANTIPPYAPKNYDGQFHGKVTARAALANSYNIPAVKTLELVGVPGMVELARRMGVSTFGDPGKYGLALTLGGGEVRLLDLTAAYGVLATGGQRVPPVSILKVTDSRGAVVDQLTGSRPAAVVDAQHAWLITSMLSDNDARAPAFGANSPLRLSRPAAVKTGTTDDYRDNWTVGYTSQLVTGVWVGNADNTSMRGTTGLTGAAPIWHDFMEYALSPLPVDPLSPAPGLQKVAVGRTSGKLWSDRCQEPKLEDYFVAGTAPREKCEAPTPTPSPTAPPATPTEYASPTPRATWTPGPTIEELRARVATTATAAAGAFATRIAEREEQLAPARALTPTSTPYTRTSSPPAVPTAAAGNPDAPGGPGGAPGQVQVAGVQATPQTAQSPQGVSPQQSPTATLPAQRSTQAPQASPTHRGP